MPKLSKAIGVLQSVETYRDNEVHMFTTTGIGLNGEQTVQLHTQNTTVTSYSAWLKDLETGRDRKIEGIGALEARPGHTVAVASYNGVDLLAMNFDTGSVYTRNVDSGFIAHVVRGVLCAVFGLLLLPICLLISIFDYLTGRHSPGLFGSNLHLPAGRKENLLYCVIGFIICAVGVGLFVLTQSMMLLFLLPAAMALLGIILGSMVKTQTILLTRKLRAEFDAIYKARTEQAV